MRSKANKQSKFMQVILAPVKILTKARDFYMKSVQDCAGKIGNYDGAVVCPTSHVVHLSKSLSVNSSKPIDDEEFRELLRAASRKNMESKVKLNLYRRSEMKQTTTQRSGMAKSYSVGVRKMQRIDEDEPCAFEEDDLTTDLLYARSRSQVVNRNFLYR